MTMAARSSKTISASVCAPMLSDAELVASARQELVEPSLHIGRLEKAFAELSTERPRRELGWLAGKGDLTIEQALAPIDEDDIKAWGL